jgi:hypothetical protein
MKCAGIWCWVFGRAFQWIVQYCLLRQSVQRLRSHEISGPWAKLQNRNFTDYVMLFIFKSLGCNADWCVGISQLASWGQFGVRCQGHLKYLFVSIHGVLLSPTSRCILFDGENISFDISIVIYINNINIPPIMIINRIPGVLISP